MESIIKGIFIYLSYDSILWSEINKLWRKINNIILKQIIPRLRVHLVVKTFILYINFFNLNFERVF
jgi:hypothetical protein